MTALPRDTYLPISRAFIQARCGRMAESQAGVKRVGLPYASFGPVAQSG